MKTFHSKSGWLKFNDAFQVLSDPNQTLSGGVFLAICNDVIRPAVEAEILQILSKILLQKPPQFLL